MTAMEMRTAYWNHYMRLIVADGILAKRTKAARNLYMWANKRYYAEERNNRG